MEGNQMVSFEEIRKTTVYLRANGDAEYDGISKQGIKVIDPYYGNPLFFRLIREAWFRLHFPLRCLWYRRELKKSHFPNIIIEDGLITKHFLQWLLKAQKGSCIFLVYRNLVGRAQHILPKDIPEGISVWTYDAHDAQQYGMHLNTRLFITPEAKVLKKEPIYDVLFIGRDKGRYPYLSRLEKELQAEGLRTCFYITKTRKFFIKKKYHQRVLTYGEVLGKVAQTRAILNVAFEGQQGLSVRDMECATNQIKLISNNPAIKEKPIYYPENVFLLQTEALEDVKSFLDKPFCPLPEEFFEKNSLFGWLKVILGYEEN